MEPLSTRDLERELGISHGLAVEILKLPNAPDVAKFRAKESYLRKLCKAAITSGHKAEPLRRYLILAESGETRPSGAAEAVSEDAADTEPRRIRFARPSEDTGGSRNGSSEKSGRGRARAPARESSGSDPVTGQSVAAAGEATDFEMAANACRRLAAKMATHIEQLLDNEDVAQASLFVRDFTKVLQELRQTENELDQRARERLEVFQRADVFAACAKMWFVQRNFGERLIGHLVDIGHLPAWLQAAGVACPDTREFRQQLTERIRSMVAADFNALADTLAGVALCALPDSEDDWTVPAEVEREVRNQMAAELEAVIAKLRR